MRRIVASALGLGLIPRRLWGSDAGAGTFGAALAAAVGALLLGAPWYIDAAVAGAAIIVALWAAAPHSGDPGWVAIDEVAGTLVAFIGLTGVPWLVALAVARLADITKMLPLVGAAERLEDPLGVVADDVVAGAYGLGVGWVLVAFGA